jgi:Putative Ig domain
MYMMIRFTEQAGGSTEFSRLGILAALALMGCSLAEAQQSLSITTPATLPAGTVGTLYSQTLSATGGSPPYAWFLVSGLLPNGLNLAANGLISGTPTTTGPSSFTLQVSDSVSSAVTQAFSLTIAPATASSLAITTTSLPQASANLPYSQTLAATGGVSPYTWSLSSGALPPGLSLSASGAITGTPTVVGASTFTVSVTDSARNSAAQMLTITVQPGTIVISSLPHFAAGAGFVTGFYALNENSQPASFAIAFNNDTGQPVAVPFAGLSTTATLADTIVGFGVKYYEAGTYQAALISGSGVISSNPGIIIQALVRRLGSDGSYYEAAIPSSTGNFEFDLPFDFTIFAPTGAQIYTGFAISNTDSANPSVVTCVARDALGNYIPNAVSVPTLQPLGHFASYQFPALVGLRGALNCSSTTHVGAVALRAIGANAISSLPVISIQ